MDNNKQQQPLSSPPFPGALGQEIAQTVSQETWQQWLETQIKIINENRLDLSAAKDRQVLLQHLQQFLQSQRAKPAAANP
ncbi:MAG: Fe(2+)-trafficking protein [Myxococcota bacterium]